MAQAGRGTFHLRPTLRAVCLADFGWMYIYIYVMMYIYVYIYIYIISTNMYQKVDCKKNDATLLATARYGILPIWACFA